MNLYLAISLIVPNMLKYIFMVIIYLKNLPIITLPKTQSCKYIAILHDDLLLHATVTQAQLLSQ